MNAEIPVLASSLRVALDDAGLHAVLGALAQELTERHGLDFAWFGVESEAGRHATLASAANGPWGKWLGETLVDEVDTSAIIHLLLQAPDLSSDVGLDWIPGDSARTPGAAPLDSLIAAVVTTPQRPWHLVLLGVPRTFAAGLQEALLAEVRWLIQRADQRERDRQLVTAMEQAGNSMFLTRADGSIVWLNEAFTRLTGFTPQEALGRNPRILKSGRQGARYYQDLWRTISSGEVWSSETVDKDRFGYLYAIDQTISPVTQDGEITHYLSVHADVTRKRVLRLEAERAAGQDTTTGLLNATTFRDRLGAQVRSAKSSGKPFAVMSLSLSGLRFAAENRDMEKAALDAVADCLREAIGPGDSAAIMGAHDFALLLASVSSPTEAEYLAASLCSRLREPLPVFEQKIQLSPRIAFALFPKDGRDAETLWRSADDALAGNAP